ncbi:uncharacterized protein EV420DRAFT_1643594 [Desarmillaria tabescens]|uniref:Uncharacterized protein n=1 Tax=Armillaria tabescens TaxID=1929756 RepID=A0AA39N4M3_ARMTA|nr:uncharacterized protein EV420DRAFT_1643594 [Desarmillaria tabescens]KAK0457742.1 hypothetical protein EV420DRAFT_1643594 [Desarmillaria tabescens]
MLGPISTIHLPASQSSPPTQHFPGDSLGFPDPPAPLVFPVDPADISNSDIQKVTRLWPSCVPLFTIMGNLHLQEHRDRIIQVLKLGRNRKLGNGLQTASARVLNHHQYTNTFSEETRMLDRLLMSVFACTTFTKDVVYKMDENLYQELCTKLTTRRAIASSSLNTFSYSDLWPPAWAINTAKCLTANDFEIHALWYHICVEHFLHMLDGIHDWDKCRTREMLQEEFMAALHQAYIRKEEKESPTVPLAPGQCKPHQSKTPCQSFTSDWSLGGVHGSITRKEEQCSRKKRVPNLEALDYNTSVSIDQNLTGHGIRTFRIASNTWCAPLSEKNRNSLLPPTVRCHIDELQKDISLLSDPCRVALTHPQLMTDSDATSHDMSTCVMAPTKSLTSELPYSSGRSNICRSPSNISEAISNETSLDSQNGEDRLKATGRRWLTTLSSIVNVITGDESAQGNHQGLHSQAEEEKTLSRKTRRALERERTICHQQELMSGDIMMVEYSRPQSEFQHKEPLLSSKYNFVSSKLTFQEMDAADQVNKGLWLNARSNHKPFSWIIIPMTVPTAFSSSHTQNSLLMHSDQAPLPESRSSVSIFKKCDFIVSVSHVLNNEVTDRRITPMRRLDDQIWDPGTNMRGTVETGITLEIKAENSPGSLMLRFIHFSSFYSA